MTDPAIIHVMTVLCGTLAIFILAGAFIIIRDCCLKKRNEK